jgi:tRNA threonylcarbamoyladenosine biosynthesis protein TsaE
MTRVALYELAYFVRNILAVLMIADPKDSSTLLALEGNLGAGKTTFVQALARDLGVRDVVQLSDPSANTNRKFTKLVHIDAYRLESPEEFDALRPEEFLNDPRALVVIEWPGRLEGKLPEPDMTLTFSADDMTQDERDIDAV